MNNPISECFHDLYNWIIKKIGSERKIKKVAFFLIFFIIIPIILVCPVIYFFYLPENYPTGEEYIFLDTYTEIDACDGKYYLSKYEMDRVDLNGSISCYCIREDYIDNYLEFYLKISDKDFNKDICMYTRREYKKVDQKFLEVKSRFHEGFSELEQLAEIQEICPSWGVYSGIKDGYRKVGISLSGKIKYLPENKEMLFIFRNLYFINSPNLDVNASIEFYFPPDWVVVACSAEGDNVSVLYSGMNAIFTKAEINEVNESISYFIILKRDISKISLENTKIGIIIGLFLAVTSMMIALGEKIHGYFNQLSRRHFLIFLFFIIIFFIVLSIYFFLLPPP
jgi:hypothetical protein